MTQIAELKLLLAKLDNQGLSIKEMNRVTCLFWTETPALLAQLDKIYDWAGRACYLMCDAECPEVQEQLRKLVVEWDNWPEHKKAIQEMGEAWAKGE